MALTSVIGDEQQASPRSLGTPLVRQERASASRARVVAAPREEQPCRPGLRQLPLLVQSGHAPMLHGVPGSVAGLPLLGLPDGMAASAGGPRECSHQH